MELTAQTLLWVQAPTLPAGIQLTMPFRDTEGQC